jgi:hypothetical protein
MQNVFACLTALSIEVSLIVLYGAGGSMNLLWAEWVVKVHLGPYLISVIKNNPNKNLIILMSIK